MNIVEKKFSNKNELSFSGYLPISIGKSHYYIVISVCCNYCYCCKLYIEIHVNDTWGHVYLRRWWLLYIYIKKKLIPALEVEVTRTAFINNVEKFIGGKIFYLDHV